MSNIDTDEFWNDWKTQREEENAQTRERDARYGYQVVVGKDLDELENSVYELLKKGWRPTGGVFQGVGRTFYQAMVKT